MIFWPQVVGRWEEDMKEAWKRQVWKTTSWRRVGGPAGAVFHDMKHLGIVLPSWHVLKPHNGRMISLQNICPEEGKDNFDQACNSEGWKHRHGELRQGGYLGENAESNLDCETCCTGKIEGHQRGLNAPRHVFLSAGRTAIIAKQTVPKHRLYHCCGWRRERNTLSDVVGSCEVKAKSSHRTRNSATWTSSESQAVQVALGYLARKGEATVSARLRRRRRGVQYHFW